MLLGEHPYYLLTNEDVIKETGAWVHDSTNSLLESREFIFNLKNRRYRWFSPRWEVRILKNCD